MSLKKQQHNIVVVVIASILNPCNNDKHITSARVKIMAASKDPLPACVGPLTTQGNRESDEMFATMLKRIRTAWNKS